MIQVVDYDASWPARFADERERLRSVLGDAACRIEHVGSTSVTGLAAKPVIDILIGTDDLARLDRLDDAMEAAGYQIRGENGIAGRRYYRRHAPDGTRLVHVHAFLENSEDFSRHLVFRDYLRAHPVEAGAYGRLKLAMAISASNREAYQAGKSTWIGHAERRALTWSGIVW